MNIGVDIRCLLDEQPSGVGEYARELLVALICIDTKNQYHLFANARAPREPQLPQSVREASHVTLHRFNYPNKLFNFFLRFFHYPKIDQLIAKKGITLDVFFMPNLNFVALSAHLPLVLTMHDLSFEFYPSFFSRKGRLWHWAINPRALAVRTTRLLAVSEHTKNDLAHEYGIPLRKIVATPLAVSNTFKKEVTDGAIACVRDQYHLPKRFILFLATVEPRKNAMSVCEAFELLKTEERFSDVHLVIAGRHSRYGIPAHYTSMPDVHFIGYVPIEDRPALYSLASVFAYPSFYEGFGLPPLEAMTMGTPVVASYVSSLGEMLGNAALLIDPHNVEDLRHALALVLSDDVLANELREKGLERASHFSWDKTARKTLEVLSQSRK